MARVALVGADIEFLTFYRFMIVARIVRRLPNRNTCAWHITMPTVSSGSRGQTPNGLVYIDVDIRFINNFPTCRALVTKNMSHVLEIRRRNRRKRRERKENPTRLFYLLPDKLFNNIFQRNNTESAVVSTGILRDQHHVRFALLEKVDNV